MSDVKISDLPEMPSPGPDDLIPIYDVVTSITKKVKVSNISVDTTAIDAEIASLEQADTDEATARSDADDALYAAISANASGELKEDGTLVWPGATPRTMHYDANGNLTSITTVYNSLTYTMTWTGNPITVITVGDGTHTWTKTLAYTLGILQSVGHWV